MPVNRGYPRGGGTGGASGTGGAGGGTSGGGGEGSTTVLDVSSLAIGMADITAALNTSQTPKEVMISLALYTGEGLVILASPDYRAYVDFTAYSGSILKVVNTGTLLIYGDLSIDNEAFGYLDVTSTTTINIKGD